MEYLYKLVLFKVNCRDPYLFQMYTVPKKLNIDTPKQPSSEAFEAGNTCSKPTKTSITMEHHQLLIGRYIFKGFVLLFPYHPCMPYLPTFTIENHGKSTIHVGKYTVRPMDASWD